MTDTFKTERSAASSVDVPQYVGKTTPNTLGELLASIGLDDPDVTLDDPAFTKCLDAVLGGNAEGAAAVITPVGPKVRTAEEQALVDRMKARQKEQPSLPKWVVKYKRGPEFELRPENPDVELARAQTMEALGLTSSTSLSTILNRLAACATNEGFVEQHRLNSLLALVASVGPRDEVEAHLAVEMALIHDAMLSMASSLRRTETLPQQDSSASALIKLSRTYALLLETLKRLRSNGQQQVVIKRIEVREGGQAMVGAIGNAPNTELPSRRARRNDQRGLPPPHPLDQLPLPMESISNDIDEPVAITIPIKR